MMGKIKYIGIDIGSVAIALAILDSRKQIVHTAYAFHNGRIVENLQKLFHDTDLSEVRSIGYTSSSPSIFSQGKEVDSRIAYISAARHLHPGLRSLLIVGAEKFGLVSFDENGVYRNFKSNSSCAAGTGNFLDQQAERLNLANIQEFSWLAYENTGECPQIASRCAVFAKTDLIHVQQEGYSLGEICDGLSYGLAKNIVDTVFQNQNSSQVVAAGGVALNKAVIGHIEQLTGCTITVGEYPHLYGAIGAALQTLADEEAAVGVLKQAVDFINTEKKERHYYYPSLQLKLSDYPDFGSHETYEFRSAIFPSMKAVEVDVYISVEDKTELGVYLGIDIGSTSTKAVLLDIQKEVIAGFYTRTSGQPLQAVQLLFECIDDFSTKRNVQFEILAAGTTGSGRKFTGQIIGADTIVDEISAHARAAYELNPETDTIIEIGGQDSKFTLMHKGMVTFSVMNNVCAAGTGSFIEEQAKRLGCSLFNYADRVEKVQSPMASDRCTVFMERDLNHYLMAGYSSDEILAAVLHSTRENYLIKVAKQGNIGNTIFFQGATAKNRALVAAFEQKLQKPILVSRYCHLTGALGVALDLHDNPLEVSKFKGLDLYRKSIPIRSEVCQLCTNHCKLKVAEVDGRTEAYGFLCGRDYEVNKYVQNKNAAFQLIRKRNQLFRVKPTTKQSTLTIGIPAGLHLYEEVSFWQKFFDLLSIRTVTSADYTSPVKDGKKLTGAEFCAPIAALHGHVDYLKDKADYIFLPTYLEEHQSGEKNRQYCYYTQFVTSVISVQKNIIKREKLLIPLLKSAQGELFNRLELYRMLRKTGISNLNFVKLTLAYETAKKEHHAAREKWRALYRNEIEANDDIHIMLLGRPYTVLSRAMNNHIPTIFEKMGVKTFFMDMLPGETRPITKSEELIKAMKWKFASKILRAAEVVAQTPDCYPVLITSFKCTPDSFVMEYFKDILDAYTKPYLILQLDEHDSAVGYETRIEAGIRAFRNHRERKEQEPGSDVPEINIKQKATIPISNHAWNDPVKSLVNEASRILQSHSIDFKLFSKSIQQIEVPETQLSDPIITGAKNMKGKTLLLPSYDLYSGPLLEAVLQNSGIDARLTACTLESTQRSLSFNTGQCIPLNIIVQNAIDYIEENKLNPADTLLWIMQTELTCNLSMFPHYMKKLLNNYGKGMEQASVYVGHMIFYDFSLPTAINAYVAHMFSGYIRRISCGIRPYEKQAGATDAVIQESLQMLYDVFLTGKSKEQALEKIIRDFEAIETVKTDRPKVAIFGDLYVRDNDLMNQNLIQTIEANGGEVITTPYSEYVKIIAEPMSERFFKEGFYRKYVQTKFLTSLIPLVEGKYRKYLDGFSGTEQAIQAAEADDWLNAFGLNIFQRGESIENILKIHHLMKQHPDLDLFIQTNPSYCCPSLVTEAMNSKIEELTGVPVLTIEYDGTAGFKNQDLIPYLKYRKKKN
ncbi:acyl-CoA dehydratase activase [Prolixibacteraceae bacterium Z1-6]|uniref:Acyl-CoA dehydratase activase n=1 Tax=Draconibacterium aestuarii TaxID=2998507 RepID=A0A9X3FA11_9BACT|nr:acyl-CoA dehydratase activase [Prolixibacteraceae bacterium Z1-6]